jgi:hypothetical protein
MTDLAPPAPASNPKDAKKKGNLGSAAVEWDGYNEAAASVIDDVMDAQVWERCAWKGERGRLYKMRIREDPTMSIVLSANKDFGNLPEGEFFVTLLFELDGKVHCLAFPSDDFAARKANLKKVYSLHGTAETSATNAWTRNCLEVIESDSSCFRINDVR